MTSCGGIILRFFCRKIHVAFAVPSVIDRGDGLRDLVRTRHAEEIIALALRRFLDQKRRVAFRTSLVDRLIPHDEVAVGVIGATIEKFSVPGFPANDLTTVFRAQHVGDDVEDGLRGFAFGIVRTGHEFTEPSHLDHHWAAALRAFFVRDFRFRRLAVLSK